MALPQQNPEKYVICLFGNYQIVCAHTKTGVYMCLTDLMLPKVINTSMKLQRTMKHWFYHPWILEHVK